LADSVEHADQQGDVNTKPTCRSGPDARRNSSSNAGEKARMALKKPADLRLAVNPSIGVGHSLVLLARFHRRRDPFQSDIQRRVSATCCS
jgi:hypothetical protein